MTDERKIKLIDLISVMPNEANLAPEFMQEFLQIAFDMEKEIALSDYHRYRILKSMIYGAWQGSRFNGITAEKFREYDLILRGAYIDIR